MVSNTVPTPRRKNGIPILSVSLNGETVRIYCHSLTEAVRLGETAKKYYEGVLTFRSFEELNRSDEEIDKAVWIIQQLKGVSDATEVS